MNSTIDIPEQSPGWRCGNAFYPLLRDAQKAALESVIGENLQAGIRGDISALLIDRKEDVIKILSLEGPKERKPRADKGTKRTKKIAPVTANRNAPAPPPTNTPPEDANKMEPLPKYRGK